MIVFKYKKEDGAYIQLKSVENATWMEVADDFVNFLQGCGYILQGIDVAEYLEEQYRFQREDSKVDEQVSRAVDTMILRHATNKKKRKKK